MRLDYGTPQGCCPGRGLSVDGLGIVQTAPGLDCTLFHSLIPFREAGLYDPLVVRPLNVPGAMCWGRGAHRRPAYPGVITNISVGPTQQIVRWDDSYNRLR